MKPALQVTGIACAVKDPDGNDLYFHQRKPHA